MSGKWTDRVSARLKAKGYRRLDLARMLDVSEGAVSNYLAGRREPSLNQIKEIARMLDMSLSELLGDDATFISDEDQIKAAKAILEIPKDQRELAFQLLETLKPKPSK